MVPQNKLLFEVKKVILHIYRLFFLKSFEFKIVTKC